MFICVCDNPGGSKVDRVIYDLDLFVLSAWWIQISVLVE